jgi:hypothetical protein
MCVVAAVLIAVTFVAVEATDRAGTGGQRRQRFALSESEATELAIELANKECTKQFGVAPFSDDTAKARLVGRKWVWGDLGPGGTDGYSARVEFRRNGRRPKVEVLFSTDQLEPGRDRKGKKEKDKEMDEGKEDSPEGR